MKCFSIKADELKENKELSSKFKNPLELLINLLKQNFEDCEDIQGTFILNGNWYSPSKFSKTYRLGTPTFEPNQFNEKEGLKDPTNNFNFLTIGFRKIIKEVGNK